MHRHPTRRDILKLGGTAAASALVLPAMPALAGAAWKRIPVGTQLWCVRKQLATDIPGTLGALGAAGFDGVELENAFGKPGTEWRKHLDAAKLKACGFHHTLGELQGEKLAATVEFNQAVDNRNLIIRSLAPEVYKSADLLKKTADAVNEAAEKVKAHKMRVGYHNHFADFNRIDGEYLVEPLRRSDDEGRHPAAGHRQRLGIDRREPRRPRPAQRRPHRHDARQAGTRRRSPTPTSAPTNSTGPGSCRPRNRWAAWSGTSSSTSAKACRRSTRSRQTWRTSRNSERRSIPGSSDRGRDAPRPTVLPHRRLEMWQRPAPASARAAITVWAAID